MNEHSDLSRLYHEADLPDPPQALDESILVAARNAASQSAGKPVRRLQQWRAPLALAATVLLSVGVTSMVLERQPHNVPFPAINTGATEKFNDQQSASVPAGALDSSPRMDEPVATPAYSPMMKVESDAATADEKSSLTRSNAMENVALDKAVQPAPGAAAPAPEARLGGALNAAAAPTGAAATESSVGSAAAPTPRDQRAKAMEIRKENGGVAGQTGFLGEQREQESPDQWIASIRELKHTGRAVEAKARLIEFTKRFPDYKLPDDLK